MLTVGVDAHKSIHVAVAVDDRGQEVTQWRGANSPSGWQSLQVWATDLDGERQWGIEGAWNYGRGLAQHLVAQGETVYEVNARWTAQSRQRARRPGKTDRQDARAVAHFVRQEAPALPQVAADDATSVLELLTSERATTVIEATRLRNQLHALLLQLDPEYKEHLPRLETREEWSALEQYEAPHPGALAQVRAAAVRRLAQRLGVALTQVEELAVQIRTATEAGGFAPLTEICGVGWLLAGTLAGVLGPGQRFQREAELAAYAGVAPLEASSASLVRHRLNRGGNRRLNSLVHMVAVTQLRCHEPAKVYLKRRVSEGKTKREALRALKRYLIRAIWQAWKRCLAPPSPAQSPAN
jgi:transposase